MHQVLSYETAVRANDREYHEYVTKRTCISLFLTIAFVTLITGYLLGNFVADRNFQIRQSNQKQFVDSEPAEPPSDLTEKSFEISGRDYATLQEIHAYGKSKEQLLASAHGLTKLLQQQDRSYVAGSVNTEIFNKYISCTQETPPNTSIEASAFIEQLIDNTAARQRDCLSIIKQVIDNNLTTS